MAKTQKGQGLTVTTRKVSELANDPANARKHDDKNIEAIKASLQRFGQQKPIVVDSSGVVRAGNGTLQAAKALGWDKIDCVVTDLKGAEATAYAIADNRSAELAEWDDDVLTATLQSLADEDPSLLIDAGFDEKELAKLVAQTAEPLEEDEVPEPPADPVTKTGDLWLLGEHRLLCGDSTKAEDVARVMDGAKASLVFTDPPYGVNFQSNMRTATPKFERLANDDTILDGWVPHARDNSTGWVFVWTTWKVLDRWMLVTKTFGPMSNMVVWHKGGGGIGDLKKTFATDHELALVFNRSAELCGKRIGSVWSYGKDAASTYAHPTQKPVALAGEAIDKTTRRGDLVADFFLGSGTTLIAAEQLGRKCYGLEIDPAYCDVIVARWEKLTGKKAELEQRDSKS